MRRILMVGLPDRPHAVDIVRRLRDESYSVATLDRTPPRWHGPLVESIAVPSFGERDVVAAAREAHRRRRLDGIALFHENWVEVSTYAAAALGLPHLPLEQVPGCRDKAAMRDWMRASGVRCPDFAAVDDLPAALAALDRIGYPAVIKPRSGGASFGVTRLDGARDVRAFFDHVDIFWRPRRFIVERFLPGPEVSLETVVDEQHATHLAFFEKPQVLDGPYFLEHTYVAPGRHDPATERAIRATVAEMVRLLGLSRVILHTELRLTPEGPVVIEFGVRPIGWPGPECVRAVSGVDEVLLMARLACGQTLHLAPEPTGAAAGWRYLTLSRPGKVREVTGLESALRLPGVLATSCWAQPGDQVGIPPEDFDYIRGFVAVRGGSAQEVARTLASVDVRFEVEPHRAGT